MFGKKGQAAIELPSATARPLLGQAAMEYLMTYGWALLVIVVVIAILLVMNPFSSPQTCRFDTVGFACENVAVIGTATPTQAAGTLLGGVTNGNNNGVTIKGVFCQKADPGSSATLPINIEVARQGSYAFKNVTCTNPNAPAKGGDFTTKIWVYYKNAGEGDEYPTRVAVANLVTKTL